MSTCKRPACVEDVRTFRAQLSQKPGFIMPGVVQDLKRYVYVYDKEGMTLEYPCVGAGTNTRC